MNFLKYPPKQICNFEEAGMQNKPCKGDSKHREAAFLPSLCAPELPAGSQACFHSDPHPELLRLPLRLS